MKDYLPSEAEIACLELSKDGWEFTLRDQDNLLVSVTIEHPKTEFGPFTAHFPPGEAESALWLAARIASSLDGP